MSGFDEICEYLSCRLDKKKGIALAVFAAKSVLPFFKKCYPEIDEPEKAIRATERYLENPCGNTTKAARVVVKNSSKLYDKYANDVKKAFHAGKKRELTAARKAYAAADSASFAAYSIYAKEDVKCVGGDNRIYSSLSGAMDAAINSPAIKKKIVNYGVSLLINE